MYFLLHNAELNPPPSLSDQAGGGGIRLEGEVLRPSSIRAGAAKACPQSLLYAFHLLCLIVLKTPRCRCLCMLVLSLYPDIVAALDLRSLPGRVSPQLFPVVGLCCGYTCARRAELIVVSRPCGCTASIGSPDRHVAHSAISVCPCSIGAAVLPVFTGVGAPCDAVELC